MFRTIVTCCGRRPISCGWCTTGKSQSFDGDLDDYSSLILASRRERSSKEGDGADRRNERKQEAVARQRIASARKPLQNKLNAVESGAGQISNELRELDVRLADPDFYHSGAPDEVAATLKRRGELARKVDSLESRWLEIQGQLEAIVETSNKALHEPPPGRPKEGSPRQ